MLPLAVGAFACLAVYFGVAACVQTLSARPAGERRRAARRLREIGGGSSPELPDLDEPRGGLRAAVARIGGWLVPRTPAQAADLTAQLARAGFRNPAAARYFAGVRIVAVVALALGVGGTAVAARVGGERAALWAAAGAAVGFIAPGVLLNSRVAKRQRQLRAALPDALDILVLSVEGGASFNAALDAVTDEIRDVHPLLGAEMAAVQQEMRLGSTAGEAFRAFAERAGLAEARDLAGILIQSEKYGASVAKALRTYSDAAREDRQMWAEEVAQKAAVKVMFPMILCIFPAMFIVLLGPAAMQMSRLFAR